MFLTVSMLGGLVIGCCMAELGWRGYLSTLQTYSYAAGLSMFWGVLVTVVEKACAL